MKVQIGIGHLPIGIMADNRKLARLMLDAFHAAFEESHRINCIADDVLSDVVTDAKINFVRIESKNW